MNPAETCDQGSEEVESSHPLFSGEYYRQCNADGVPIAAYRRGKTYYKYRFINGWLGDKNTKAKTRYMAELCMCFSDLCPVITL